MKAQDDFIRNPFSHINSPNKKQFSPSKSDALSQKTARVGGR